MVGIAVGPGSEVRIVGHGLRVSAEFELATGVRVSPETPMHQSSFGSTISRISEDTALIVMESLADFSLVIDDPQGGKVLATKAWNSLWTFSLLGLSIGAPVMPLYSFAQGAGFAIANRICSSNRFHAQPRRPPWISRGPPSTTSALAGCFRTRRSPLRSDTTITPIISQTTMLG